MNFISIAQCDPIFHSDGCSKFQYPSGIYNPLVDLTVQSQYFTKATGLSSNVLFSNAKRYYPSRKLHKEFTHLRTFNITNRITCVLGVITSCPYEFILGKLEGKNFYPETKQTIRFEGTVGHSVYFMLSTMQGKNVIKIGRSNNIESRLKGFRISNPDIKIVGYVPHPSFEDSVKMESALHRKFKHLRITGEWFQVTPEIRNYITQLNRYVTV